MNLTHNPIAENHSKLLLDRVFQIRQTSKYKKSKNLTGWSISILHNLTGWYDNNNACTKKIVVDLCSVYRDISTKTNNLKISKFLLCKKLNLNLESISAQNSTHYFESVCG